MDPEKMVVIIGSGPAGLTAAYDLCKSEIPSIVIEKDDIVGGISRTVEYKGYKFDIGGHRFYTKVQAVDEMWHQVLKPEDFLRRKRLSRIYYNRKFFYYPLRAMDALGKLGLWNSFLILMSYAKSKISPQLPEKTFEQNISNRFGRRLFNIFFKTYTEKVWGIPCNELSSEWANQRIQGFGLGMAIKKAVLSCLPFLLSPKYQNATIKTLIDEFDYPRKGPGMMWEKVAEDVQKQGCTLHMNAEVQQIRWREGAVESVDIETSGKTETVSGTHFISTMPIRELIQKLEPAAPPEVSEAANQLNYRDFLTVALIINQKDIFPDNWIYIHEPNVKLGRVQNFKNWSPDMVVDQNKTCLGLEYFCFEGDGLWNMTDAELVELGTVEIDRLGLARKADVEDGAVVRMPKAYPVYDSTYTSALETVRGFLTRIPNLQLVGRNGMHKYNNQDHSMLTAMLAVKNILGSHHNLWAVNADDDYHEEVIRRGRPGQ